MKRRDFLVAAGLAGSILPIQGRTQSQPCPPSTLDVEGGQGSTTPCVAPGNAEADWQSRIGAPGVVWFHDFRNAREIDAFRWLNGYGNDPGSVYTNANRIRRITTDGITGGGCMEIWREGTADLQGWWRPFSPLKGGWPGNGKAADDPGARDGRHIAPRAWDPTSGSPSAITPNHTVGYYGHSSYHALDPGHFDGTEYYLQVRVKVDPNRLKYSGGGKLFYFTRTDRSATDQEIVTISGKPVGGRNMFWMYRSISPPLTQDWPGHGSQPGSEIPLLQGRDGVLCDFGAGALQNCWSFSGGWDTLLYRIRPGLSGNNDTLVQVSAAHPGETAYTKIWDQPNVDLPFDVNHPRGHNALICSGYLNGIDTGAGIYHRYAQIIFSLDPIPCPKV